jgi:hypothetical protein
MTYGIYLSPAIVALVIFYQMRNKQATRNDKRRERLWYLHEQLIQMLQNNKEKTSHQNQHQP